MPKLLLPLLFLVFSTHALLAQTATITGQVTDAATQEPLPFVNISLGNTNSGAVTDLDGRFQLRVTEAESTTLYFSYIGYEKKSVGVKPQNGPVELNISLSEKTDQLNEVQVFPGENPAHRIIRNAVQRRVKNNPENLPSFSYKSYSKFVANLNTDSIGPGIDTVFHPFIKDSILRIDSGNYKLEKMLEKQHLFFMESVTERHYLKGKRDNETVLASKTSGFKNPLFALVSTELQSFSFYNDYISILGEDFLNPITPGSTGRYFFLLEDTAYNSPTDTVFVISYRPRPNYGFKPLQGLLYINTSDWAVQNVVARPVETTGMQVEIEQNYRRYDDHTWFPAQLNAIILMRSIDLNGSAPEATMRTYLSDVQIGESLRPKDISRAEVTIEEGAVRQAPELLRQFRTDSLSQKELRTYDFMDSLGEAEHFDERLKLLVAFGQGKIPVWKFDIDLGRVVSYNDYEGFRLGAGAHTNARFSKFFKIGGYAGYGFKDEVWKYGWDAKLSIHKRSNLALLGGYQFDLFETGGVQFVQQEDKGLLEDNYRRLLIPQWDQTSRYFAGLTYDPLPTLQLKILAQRENRLTIGNYFFIKNDAEPALSYNGFNFFEVVTALRYAPRETFVEGPGFGKLMLERKYPVLFLQYTRGLQGVFDSEFEYDKIDLQLTQQIKTLFVGVTTLSLKAGSVLQPLPYAKLYAGQGNLKNTDDLLKRWGVPADRNSFETMHFNEFLSDRYVQLMYRQDFKSLLFRRKNFAPHIEVVARAMWGNLDSPQLHQNLDFKIPRFGYYEAGLELNKLLKINFTALGIGAYYRLGPYRLPDFTDNFALKLTSKFAL